MSKFRTKLATLKKGTRYFGLEMPNFTDPLDPDTYVSTPKAVSLACGEEMDFGRLFTYLFRRFGYPNKGWDNYKELAKYVLTTPLSDMVLVVVPYCGNGTGHHFSFMVTGETFQKIRNYDRRDYLAWRDRMFDWIEENNKLPEWLGSAMEHLNKEHASPLTWRQTYESLGTLHSTKAGKKPVSVGYNWQQKVQKEYSKIEEPPAGSYQRSYDWREWPDDDPCKAYNQAAYETLLDLKRPVCVRDQYIDAFGLVSEEDPDFVKRLRHETSYAAAAGYPSGALGNDAPKEFSELHSLIIRLGNGNTKRGIKRVMELCGQVQNARVK